MGSPFSLSKLAKSVLREGQDVVAPVTKFVAEKVVAPGTEFVSGQVERLEVVAKEEKILKDLYESSGDSFPGDDYFPSDPKNWISGLNPEKVHLNEIVWPGTHDSGTNEIGIEMISRPLAQCQYLSIYEQLVLGARLLDIRVNENRDVCHGILTTYNIDVVINDVKKFISETESEIIILEIRTEFGHTDPPEFIKYLEEQLGEHLIHQDDQVFHKTVAEILPKRIICVWKPRNTDPPKADGMLWSSGYLKDNWIDTDLPATKFESNLKYLSEQQPVNSRKYFYRVENTLTPQGPQVDNPLAHVKPISDRIQRYAKLFISQCFSRKIVDRLQVFSTDFIDEDFVRVCICLTRAKIEGKA